MLRMPVFVLAFLFLFLSPALAKQQVLPGCTFAWEEPMVNDPDNPGQKIGSWELAGDLDGFQWVTNTEEVWDPLEMSLIPAADRTVLCSIVGVEVVGPYVVMIKAYDTSGNASPYASLSFEIVQEDTTAPDGVLKLCVNWKVGDKPMQLCTEAPIE